MLAGRLREAQARSIWLWLPLAALAAVAPDLDFLPGLLVGDINRFHHGASHSLGAAIVFGGLVALGAGARNASRIRLGLAATALYASHLVLDFLTADTRPPIGQPLLWPLSSNYFAVPQPILSGIRHRAENGLASFVVDVLSVHNLNAALREVLLVTPFVVLVWLASARWSSRNARSHESKLRVRARTTAAGATDQGD